MRQAANGRLHESFTGFTSGELHGAGCFRRRSQKSPQRFQILSSFAHNMLFGTALLSTGFVAGPAPRGGSVLRVQPVSMQESVGPLAGVQKAYEIFQASKAEGMDTKQSIADAIAGEYDRDATLSEVQAVVSSAPLVLFTWDSSPACKKALKYIEETGVTPKVVRLDNPWAEGNPKRAALGRLTGKSSVPSIWIGGKYIGGCDDGPSDDAPGLVPLAFRGTLRQRLEAAGAFGDAAVGTVEPTAAADTAAAV